MDSYNRTSQWVEQLNLRGKSLSKGHRAIIAFVATHYDKAATMTAASLGENCGVSESTVVRFAVAMGYEGYPEWQEALKMATRQRLTSQQRFDMATEMKEGDVLSTVLKNDMENIRKTIEGIEPKQFDEVVARLLKARRIYIMGLRSAAPLAQFLYHYLHQIFEEVILMQNTVNDLFEEMVRISNQDVLIGISYPRYSRRTLDCMRFARQHGAQVIGLTDSEMSPLWQTSDVCLCAATDMAGFVDSLAAPLSLINALVVNLGLHRRDELSAHFEKLEEVWNANSIYLEQSGK